MSDEQIVDTDDITSLPRLEVELDWEKYFRDFCEAHGKYPVMFEDALLFPDGWRYSAYSYEGPETPPPDDEKYLHILKSFYWERRYKIIKKELDSLEHFIAQLKALERDRDRTLSQRVTYKNDDGNYVSKSEPINFKILNQRLDWLRQDMLRCTQELGKLHE
jgi:hypothetical protein